MKSTNLLLRAATLLVAVFALAPAGRADQTTGRIFGQLSEEGTGTPRAGLTVVARGPQGEEATLADESGRYAFAALPIGAYDVVVYATGAAPVERTGVRVSAGQAVRVDVLMPRQAARSETYVIERRAPMVDLGTARTGLTFQRDELAAQPIGTSYGDAIHRAPGAFVDRSGSVSIAGASGLENIYLVDGLNVTGIEFGDILNDRAGAGGGSNLPLEFVEELSISTGGYAARYGGAMGGVVNVVTKSGSNEWHGSAFSRLAPAWANGDAKEVRRVGSVLVGRTDPDRGYEVGFEVGGPLIRNRLFLWAGFAPRRERSLFVRSIDAHTDGNFDGIADRDAGGDYVTRRVDSSQHRQLRNTTPFGLKLTFLPRAEQRLNLSLFSTATKSIQAFDRTGGDAPASAAVPWALQQINKRNTDVMLAYTGHFFARRWRIEGRLGLHHERYRDGSPIAELNGTNQEEWRGTSLFEREGLASCQPRTLPGGVFDPCPLDVYRGGGYGATKAYDAQRWLAALESTHLFSALGSHELGYGAQLELAVLDQRRHFTGAPGSRALVQHEGGNTARWSFFTLPPGRYPFQFSDGAPGNLDPRGDGSPAELVAPPIYRDELRARVKNVMPAFYLQDSWSVRPNLTLMLGTRYEKQRLYDHQGKSFADLDNVALRGGAVYDLSDEGRSKAFAHYGRFYEAIPLNLAARYFGGEGIVIRNSHPGAPPYYVYNNGSNYPVQPHLEGQHHDEIVAGFQFEVRDGTLLGLELTRRWLGAIIEDGTAVDGTFVLANPGQVPDKALRAAEADVAARRAAVDAAAPADRAARQVELGAAESRYENLKGLAAAPAPERTYNALTLSVSQRIGRRVSVHAWYTYSQLYGNYNGLHDADNNYFAPNGGNAYDTPDLTLNRRGPLANDRPHAGRVSGHYEQPVGRGALVGGLSFAAFSGVPRNHISALLPSQQLVFLLPRGSGGRTPALTQLDAKLGYRHQVSALVTLELAVELFNLMNRRTPLHYDDNYTHDMAAALVNGTLADLPHAKNVAGAPVTPNQNFGRATAYQAPLHGRLYLRASF